MKKFLIPTVLAVVLILLSAGCVTHEIPLEGVTDEADKLITDKLTMISEKMYTAADVINAANGDAAIAEAALKKVYDETGYAQSIIYVNSDNICVAAYPADAANLVGRDFAVYAVGERFYEGRDVTLTYFQKMEAGYYASVVGVPVKNNDGKFTGHIAYALDNVKLLGEIEDKVCTGNLELVVIEPNGMQIYDKDTEEIGLNVLTDPLYEGMNGRAGLTIITQTESGVISYNHALEGDNYVTKTASWETIEFGGHHWRVVIAEIR